MRLLAATPLLPVFGLISLIGCDPSALGGEAKPSAGGEAPEASPSTPKAGTDGNADAKAPTVEPRGPSVVAFADAPSLAAPNGRGIVTELARGDEAFVAMLQLDPGASIPEHRDATEEFIHVLSGGGTMTIDGEKHEVNAGATIYMPANAAVSFENGSRPLRALQIFADPGPEAKYQAWAPVADAPLRHEGRCKSLAEVYCAPPPAEDLADAEDESTLDTVAFARLSLEAQAAWMGRCRKRLDTFDDEQLAQFDTCVGCVASCEDAMDCLAGADLCAP